MAATKLSISDVWTRAVVIAVVVAGCAGGEQIRDRTLDDDTHVTLPASLLTDLPLTEFHLHAHVALGDDARGDTLTVVFDCFHSPLSLAVNGVALTDIGDASVGEHRFVVPPELTRGGKLALDAHAVHDVIALNGFGSPLLFARCLDSEPANRPTAAELVTALRV